MHIGGMYRKEVDRAVSGFKSVEAYNGILQALLRLRLLCNQGTFEHYSQEYGNALLPDPEETLTLLQLNDDACCTYCSCDVAVIGGPNSILSAVITVCSHLLCSECLPQYEAELKETKVGNKAQCPLCESTIFGSFLATKEQSGIKAASRSPASSARHYSFDINHGYSTKLSALLQDVESQPGSDKW
jgi:SWI/SNF-related matrix-associated actin-dependent regulator of chromatin subfamily A3